MSPQPVLGMFLSAAFRYILSLFTLCLSQKRPASPSPRASGPMGETPPRTDPPKSALQVARPRALSPGLSALPAVHPLPPSSGPATIPPANPRQSLRSPHRHADLCPQSTPPRPKSFLEKTLTRANPPHSTPQSTHPATLLTATTSLANGRVTKLLAPLLLASVLTACEATPTQELHVFAAASLREAITEAAGNFEQTHPSVRVVSNFAGSQVLRLQIESGARADLFVSANPDHLDSLQRDALLLAPPTVVATNELVLAVPSGNSARISGIQDLTQPGRRVVMAAESVPAGAYARQMLALQAAATGRPELADAVLQRVISFETNVRQVAAKLELGEADAGFVYRTDVLASDGRLQVIETPSQVRVTANYPAAVLRDTPNPQLAERFLTFLRSPEAQAILSRHGFGPSA